MRRATLALLSIFCLVLAACGGGNPSSDTTGNNGANNGGNNGANNGGNNGGNNGVNNGANNGANNGGNNGGNNGEVISFTECEGNGDCSGDLICTTGVCLDAPGGGAVGIIGKEHRDRVVDADTPPILDCYENPTPFEGDVQYMPIRGQVEKFGVGGSTVGLCVTVYNYQRFLAHFTALCADVADPIQKQACIEVDPCRCEKDNEGDQGAIDTCFSEIGYCNGITDDTMKGECKATWAFDGSNESRDADTESTLIYGHMVACGTADGCPDDDEGFFNIPNVPTGTDLVLKVSGKQARWIDTYEFGAILTEVRNDEDGDYAPWGGNVISIGAWNTIPSTALVPQGIQPGNGAIAGRINDCGMEGRTVMDGDEVVEAEESLPVRNATVALTHDATRITYFNGNPDDTLPQPNRATTNLLAVYAGVNVPGGPNRLATAVRNDDGDIVSAGWRDVFLAPRSVAIATFEGAFAPAAW
jgi:hypothetical protein